MLDLKFTGVEEALANLRKTAAPVNDVRIGENAAAALEPVAEDARRLAPVDDGDLRDSIGIATSLTEQNEFDGKAVFVGPLGANVFYAGFIELGTVKMRAQPFLAPALHENRELVFDVLGSLVGHDMIGAV